MSMASSLEELLAEEGFRGRRSLRKFRGSLKSHAISMPNELYQEKRNSVSDLGGQFRTEMRPPLFRCSSTGKFRTRGGIKNLIDGDNFTNREKTGKEMSNEYVESCDQKGPTDVIEQTRYIINLSNDKSKSGCSVISEGGHENFKDIYSNEVHIQHGVREREHYKERSNVDIEKRQVSLKKDLLGCINFHHNDNAIIKLPERSYGKSNTSSCNRKSFGDKFSHNRNDYVVAVSTPALDVVAVQAIVSIINGYLKPFLKDKDLRLMLRHISVTLLNSVGVETGNIWKAISNFEQAINIVERAAEGSSTENDLKNAAFQLSMIAGMNKNYSKDDFTAGKSYSKLSACAHLYLSMIFQLRKKENSSAKHILQVFCDLPFQARTILLPELWDNLFLPHLAHLKDWYGREADTLGKTRSQSSNMNLLDEVYNEILDLGTHKFAVYYKDWLAGIEASAPSIAVPAVCYEEFDRDSSLDNSDGITLSDDSLSAHLMVSKKLYDSVFGTSKDPGAPDAKSEWESENRENCFRSSNSSTASKHTEMYYSDTVKDTSQDIDADSIGSTLNYLVPGFRFSSMVLLMIKVLEEIGISTGILSMYIVMTELLVSTPTIIESFSQRRDDSVD